MTKKCHRLQLKAIVIALLALILVSAPLVAAEKPDHSKAQVTSTVIKVYDGDTIKLANGMEIRYLNLDTPETHHPEKPVEYFGVKASKFNQQLVGGKKVKLEYDVQKKDQYGRHLAYVYVKGRRMDKCQCKVNQRRLCSGLYHTPERQVFRLLSRTGARS